MKNILKNPKTNIFLQWLLLALLLILLAFTLWQIVFSLEGLKIEGRFGHMHPRRLSPGPKLTPGQIRGWMTFRFINSSFNLPPAYLKGALGIGDKNYPNLTLDAFARETRTTADKLAVKISGLIQGYLTKVKAKNF